MKNNAFLIFILLTGILLGMYACNKKDEFVAENIENYSPQLQVGKFIRYKLDSLVYINFDRDLIVRKYQAKDIIDAAITDNSGRPAWRVIRYIRDSASTSEADWRPNITYTITALPKSLEVNEENIRYIKLKAPLTDGYSWKGNTYINDDSFYPSFSITSWDYTYADINAPFTFSDGRKVDSTITVNQIDEVLGNPSNPFTYTTKNYSKEVYGKNIGLVYKEFFHSEYQTFYSTYNCYFVKCTNNSCDTARDCSATDQACENAKIAAGYKKYCKDTVLTDHYYFGSYGITLKMIDHN